MTPASRKPRRSTYAPGVIQDVQLLYVQGHTPTQIVNALKLAYRDRPNDVPSLGTVKIWTKGLRRASDSPWDFMGASADDCKKIAPAFAYGVKRAAEVGEPSEAWPTQSEAEWMVRIVSLGIAFSPQRVHELGRYAAAVDDQARMGLATDLLLMVSPTPPSLDLRRAMHEAGIPGGGTAIPEANPYSYPEPGR